MSGNLSREFIESVTSRLSLVELVSRRISIKKAGREHTGKCPFHEDASPSFSVNEEKKVFYCFGCGASGGMVQFIMDFDKLDFISAIKLLASEAGIELPLNKIDPLEDEKNLILQILEKSDQLFRKQLKINNKRHHCINYLKDRTLTGETAKFFGLGFAPNEWNFLISSFKEFSDTNLLVKAGLICQTNNQFYDRFRNRVMFPIRDLNGQTVGFGGRIIDDGKPKYLNSPESIVFKKSTLLYGQYEARKHHSKLEFILVVEGYMDVISLSQHGITNSVATLGTSLSKRHIEKLARETQHIIICFDGDLAGEKAATRALVAVLPFLKDDFNVGFLFLPEGEDPDSIIRKEGKESFVQKIKNCKTASQFLFESIERDVNTETVDGRARFSSLALEKIKYIPEGIYKSLIIQELCDKTGARRDDLEFELKNNSKYALQDRSLDNSSINFSEVFDSSKLPTNIDKHSVSLEQEKFPTNEAIFPKAGKPLPIASRIIKLLLNDLSLASYRIQIDSRIDLPNLQILKQIFFWVAEHPKSNLAALMGYFSGTEVGILLKKLTEYETLSVNDKSKAEYKAALDQLKIQMKIQHLTRLASGADKKNITAYDLNAIIKDTNKN